MTEWKECKLGDIAEIQTGPFGSQLHASDYVDTGIPSIMPTNIGSRLEIYRTSIACITNDDAQRLSKYLVNEGDVVYSRRGDVEKCAYITTNEAGWLCGTGCLRIRFDKSQVLPKYCAFYLSTDEIRGWVSGHAVGTTMPNLNSTILSNLPMVCPPLPEQKAIASVLSCLDDKIDLLHRQNKTLEAMAETLFRQWFVEEAEEGWEVGILGDIVTVVSGTTPKTAKAEYWNGEYHWTSPRDITNLSGLYLFDTERRITKLGLEQIGSGLLPNGSLLMSSRAPVGALAFAEIPVAINQGYAGIICDKGFSREFVYLWLKTNMDFVQSHANGSTFQEISKSTFRELDIIIPDSQTHKKFHELISPSFGKIKENSIQIRTLEKLRDTLLPKMMSGEVRITV